MTNPNPIRDEWNKYYQKLEEIRESGECNMWEGNKVLRRECKELSEKESVDILLSWIHNYNELNKKFGWR